MNDLNNLNSITQLKYLLNIALIADKDNTPKPLLGWEKKLGLTHPYPVTRSILKCLIFYEVMEIDGYKNSFAQYIVNKKKMKELLANMKVLTLTQEVLNTYSLLF